MGIYKMTRLSSNFQSHKTSSIPPEIVPLREKLKQLKVWPEAADEFLALMPLSRWHGTPATDKDHEWIPVIAQDVFNQCDLGARYPSFFQKLLTNVHLREAFLAALEKQMNTFSP